MPLRVNKLATPANAAARTKLGPAAPSPKEVDVLVIGFGAAGAVAALQAHELGAQVLLIDRFEGGGTTAKSGGVIYAGATRFQAEAGFTDDVDNMERYLRTEVGDVVRPETLRRFCEQSAADLDWLIANGAAFSAEAHLDKASFPPEGKYLYYSGNEKSAENIEIARPVPRGHRPVGPGFGGIHLYERLAETIANADIEVRRHCRAERLLTDKTGRVVGADLAQLDLVHAAEHRRLYEQSNPMSPKSEGVHRDARRKIEVLESEHSQPITVRARMGVILATGGYAFDPALLKEFTPAVISTDAKFHRLATLGNDGAGIALGRAVGGDTRQMQSLYVARHLVPNALTHGILVNGQGQRFVAEDAYISLIGEAISKQEHGIAWLIINRQMLRQTLIQVFSSGWYLLRYYGVRIIPNLLFGGTRRGGTLAALARKIGLPVAELTESASEHDAAIKQSAPDRFGKGAEARTTIGAGPYYAINMKFSNPRAVTLLMTLGGLSVSEDSGAVLRADGSAIEGLFAAGNCAAGLHSNGYISGLAIADCVFAGRRAARGATAKSSEQS